MRYYKKNNKIYIDENDTLLKIAYHLGLEPYQFNPEPLENLVPNELLFNGKSLTIEEIHQELEKWNGIYEQVLSNPEKWRNDKYKVIGSMKEYIFIPTTDYRGGEKIIPIAIKYNEDPIEKISKYNEWVDLYKVYWDNSDVESLFLLFHEIDEFLDR